MLRLPQFDVHLPTSVAQATQLLAIHGRNARVVNGGTDIVPNAKLGMTPLGHAVLLRDIAELHGIALVDGALELGASTRLATLATDPLVRQYLPALAHAAARIASPQIRNMATLGGNLCLDTRCRYINQSELWREALGGCLKSHGTECHVVPGGQGCVAALSADTVPVLIAYGATVQIANGQADAAAQRTTALDALYDADGTRHVRLGDAEVLTLVRVPCPTAQVRVGYRKWAVRNSIDFPLVSVALRLQTDAAQLLVAGKLVVGVLGPRPRVLDLARLAGRPIDAALGRELGQWAFDRCRPLPNVPYDAEYRRERLAVEVRRLCAQLATA